MFNNLKGLSDRLDAAYYSRNGGKDLGGDLERFSTDVRPDEGTDRQHIEELKENVTDGIEVPARDAVTG